jgi:hypothetical protein
MVIHGRTDLKQAKACMEEKFASDKAMTQLLKQLAARAGPGPIGESMTLRGLYVSDAL